MTGPKSSSAALIAPDSLKADSFQPIRDRRSFRMLDLEDPEVFRAVLDSLKIGVCVVDPDRKMAFWNDRAEEITGYLRQEVLGRTCREDLLIPYDEGNVGLSERVSPFLTAMRDGKAQAVRVFLHQLCPKKVGALRRNSLTERT
jgi:PAS domain-containing protein